MAFINAEPECDFTFYIESSPYKLISYPESKWGPLKKKAGGHLEEIGRPVVLENVSGGHLEKKGLLLPFSTEAGR